MALSTEIWTPGSEEAPSDALQLQVRCPLFFCSMVEGVNNFWSTTRMTSFSSFCARFFLGGGFKYFFILTTTWGKITILTNIFHMGWNHQLVLYLEYYTLKV